MNKRYFEGLRTLAEIKAEYKRLVKVNHPDVGGDTATMQEINGQYAAAVEWIAKYGEGREQADAAKEVPAEYMAAVAAAVNLPGVVLELIGTWLWASGNTFPAKEALKAAGYVWIGKRRMWAWKPAGAAPSGHSRKGIDWIKAKYGCSRLDASSAAKPSLT